MSITNVQAASATATARMRVLPAVDYINNNAEQKIILNKNLDKVVNSNRRIEKKYAGQKEEIIIKKDSVIEVIF